MAKRLLLGRPPRPERLSGVLRAPRSPLADAIVYATARRMGADVLTGDPHFRGRRGVVYLG